MKAGDLNYCEYRRRPCHRQACNFGCEELRTRRKAAAKPAAPAPAAAPIGPAEPPVTAVEPALDGMAAQSAGATVAMAEPLAEAASGMKRKRRQPRAGRAPDPAAPVAAITERPISVEKLPVLKAALAGLESVDLLMSMAARVLGVSQTGTALQEIRETKRQLAALVADLAAGA